MKRKGISPLIAAVLLIAFTMAVATIFSQFVTGDLIKRLTQDTSQRAGNLSDCGQLAAEFQGNPDASTAIVEQTQGSEVVGNVTVTWQYNDDSVVQNTTYLGSDTALNGGNNVKDIDTVISGESGTLSLATVEATDCPGASGDQYEP